MIQAVNLIKMHSGYDVGEIAQFAGTSEKSVESWMAGKEIPDEQMKQLSASFDLPEQIFNRNLTFEDVIKLELQFHADICFNDHSNDFDYDIDIGLAAEFGMSLLKDGLPDNLNELAEELGYDSKKEMLVKIREIARKYAFIRNFMEKTMSDNELRFGNKFNIINLLYKYAESLESCVKFGETKELEELDIKRVLKTENISKPICRVFICFANGTSFLTTDSTAASHLTSRQADLDELEKDARYGNFFKDKIVHVSEGFFLWDDLWDEYEYIEIEQLKDLVLDRMEEKDRQDSQLFEVLYEQLIALPAWRVHAWLDNQDYDWFLG